MYKGFFAEKCILEKNEQFWIENFCSVVPGGTFTLQR